MKAPGTAYPGDRQPAHMDDYRNLPDDDQPTNDNGGVHLNSGIPNHAFYLAATAHRRERVGAGRAHLVHDADRAAAAGDGLRRRRDRDDRGGG